MSNPFIKFLERKNEWSDGTFGKGERAEGICKHIEKELAEVRAEPGDIFEWIDIVFLALDGAHRQGYTPEMVWNAMLVKQYRNAKRKWPVPGGPVQPVEHIR